MEIDVDNIKIVTYANWDYYRFEVINKVEMNGIEYTMPFIFLIRIENGYIYLFQFSGSEDEDGYRDFESLLESIQYPDDKEVVGENTNITWDDGSDTVDSNVNVEENTKGYENEETVSLVDLNNLSQTYQRSFAIGMFIGCILMGLIVLAAIMFLPLCLYRGIKACPIPQKKALKIVCLYAVVLGVLAVCVAIIAESFAILIALSLPIFIWSYVSYKVLQLGQDALNEESDPTVNI